MRATVPHLNLGHTASVDAHRPPGGAQLVVYARTLPKSLPGGQARAIAG